MAQDAYPELQGAAAALRRQLDASGRAKRNKGTYRAFACEKNTLRAAAAHAHKAIEAERVDVRLQAELCSVEVILQKKKRKKKGEGNN
jgi:hypothetical protein